MTRGRSAAWLRSGRSVVGGTMEPWIGSAYNPPPPEDGEQLQIEVSDPGGLSCETVVWALRMLGKMRASVWVTHEEAGSLQLTDLGRGMLGARRLWARFHEGEVLTVTATGPEAAKALDACQEMLSIPPKERKGLYRERFAGLPSAGTVRATCPVCAHAERGKIDADLEGGRSPRSLHKENLELSRADLTRHRSRCLAGGMQ